MNTAYTAYRLLSTGLFASLLPPFYLYSRITGKYRESLNQRLGFYPEEIRHGISGSPRVWIHAVSVGEVSVASAIITSLARLMPDCALILSTTTEQGQFFAREKLQNAATCIYAPVDFSGAIRKALLTIKPDVLVFIETEIWPNWLVEARRMGIKTVFVNGRISVRSIKGYLKIGSLIKEVLKKVQAFSMISNEDALRIEMIGAAPGRVEVNGNAKYDLLIDQADIALKRKLRHLYHLESD